MFHHFIQSNGMSFSVWKYDLKNIRIFMNAFMFRSALLWKTFMTDDMPDLLR